MTGPSNAEFFDFLADQLSLSAFRRAGDALTSFKTTIEFVLVPEGTEEGPAEGLFYEGTADLSYEQWHDFVAGFAIISVESRHDLIDGAASRVYRAQEVDGSGPAPFTSSRAQSPIANAPAAAEEREELHSRRGHYAWIGSRRDPRARGRVEVHLRRIACRGADHGLAAQAIFVEKLREYGKKAEASSQ